MASDLRFHWESDPSSSEESEGEDIEGVEYAPRSVDGSNSGRSLEQFLRDEDSASIQGPSFYRALDNEKSFSPAQLPRGLSSLFGKKRPAAGYQPTSPFAWSYGSAFGKQTCVTRVPRNPKILTLLSFGAGCAALGVTSIKGLVCDTQYSATQSFCFSC
ncbi:hypothetical protein KFL_006880010 [Klebsormidium nitens]|uniref:Uncharacterized protein n=1 Tax=Klebsormidium nitens TaxID=105231 RepID=A0A1Y1IMX4_KLENI|nr:hypothetical protein KFL_006880010 [Klebsormidium nitens]|eukprot:GAQ90809.1 hypothetical protein KFL_006880010 [Klebsormidium nitens]